MGILIKQRKEPKSIVVVGAGLGGIAAALGLRIQGHHVEIWDRNSDAGGKIQEWRSNGYRWDLGPSLLTMPYVLNEWFQSMNRKTEDYLTLIPLENTCRYFWQDGTVIDENSLFWARPEVQALLTYGEGIYEISGKAYLNAPPSEFWRAFHWKNWKSLIHLPKLANFKTLAQIIDEKIKNPYLRQIFYRYATYNGSSPYQTPATFSIIPYIEAHFGGWYVKGGMRRIIEAFEKIAKEEGVVFCHGEEVTSYKNGSLYSKNGRTKIPDYIVCNGEVIRSAQTWLKESYTVRERQAFSEPELSSSAFIILLGVKGVNPELKHHNIIFSQDYQEEFNSIFKSKELPLDPTIYISITQRTENQDAPSESENWFVLINMPAKTSFSEEEIENYSLKIVSLLRARRVIKQHQTIEYKKNIHSKDLAQRDLTTEGSLYGWASHSIKSSLFRPAMHHPREKIYFVGGSTHPGGGIPLVLLSAKMILRKFIK